jgi:hypothetical protein
MQAAVCKCTGVEVLGVYTMYTRKRDVCQTQRTNFCRVRERLVPEPMTNIETSDGVETARK